MDSPKSRWTVSFLQEKRSHADPLADNAIKNIIERGEETAVNDIFTNLRHNRQLKREHFPDDLAEFFDQADTLPTWADHNLLRLGAEFYSRHGLEIAMLLYYVSLPFAYSCGRGAKVLHATGRMEEHRGNLDIFTRRLMETSQFVTSMSSPGGFENSGTAIETAMKVRLMHACIRYYIKKSIPWDDNELGVPINQEDKAGTLQSFSSLVYEGLDKMGIRMEPDERAGHYHLWRVVGHLMGVDPDLIPEKEEEGHALGWAILNHQRAKSVEGKELTDAIREFVIEAIGWEWFHFLPDVLIRRYSGDEIADTLSVPKYGWLKQRFIPWLFNSFMQFADWVEHLTGITLFLSKKLQRDLLMHVTRKFYGHKEIEFYLPPNLRDDWKIPEVAS